MLHRRFGQAEHPDCHRNFEGLTIAIDDASKLYLKAGVNGQGVFYRIFAWELAVTSRQLARHLLLLARQDVKAADLLAALQPVFTSLKQAAGSMAIADVAGLTYTGLPADFKARVTAASSARLADERARVRAEEVARG